MKIGNIDMHVEVHSVPLKGLFRFSRNGKGDLAIDVWKWTFHVSNLRRVAQHYQRAGEAQDHDKGHIFERGAEVP